MTSRQRVRTVLQGRIPDRIPCGLGGCETAGLHILAYEKLQSILGAEKTPPRMDTFMSNAVFEMDVLHKLGADILLLASPHMCKAPLWGSNNDSHWKEQTLWGRSFRVAAADTFETLKDGTVVWKSGRELICPPGSFFFDSAEMTDLTADFSYISPDDYNPPTSIGDDKLRELENLAKQMYEETDFSICLGETITDLQVAPGGHIGSMVLMLEEPDVMKAFLQKSLESSLSQLAELDQAVGKYVDILSIAHDFGDNKSVTIGEDLWREIYKPFYKELFTKWGQITNMKSNFHSCGSIYAILGDLIECGLDIYNPVQISATDMDAQRLKNQFGDKLIFWGGAYDSQLFSKEEDQESVYQKVSTTLNTLAAEGSYIFSGVHNLPPEIPKHHLKAMIQAWQDYKY